jgi:hypothetical protein
MSMKFNRAIAGLLWGLQGELWEMAERLGAEPPVREADEPPPAPYDLETPQGKAELRNDVQKLAMFVSDLHDLIPEPPKDDDDDNDA